ncbi:MAG: DUF1624 domain-containing protein [Symbiobacteriaceae bacterium]|nr:DUF1624 domain-containing protein [Symbiobacteriaceae bacterium]
MLISNLPKAQRVWEIDAWRGVNIIYMVWFHYTYVLFSLYGIAFNPFTIRFPPSWIFTASFYFISGISSGFSRNPTRNGWRVAAAAFLFTLVTRFLMPTLYIRFGTLHFLATAMLLTPLWRRLPLALLPGISLLFLLLGILARGTTVATFWFLPFGFSYPGFDTLDYIPLFPYLAPYLMGIWTYAQVYAPRGRTSLTPEWLWTKPLQFIGRHSFTIYLWHQPLFLLVLIPLLGMPNLR